MPPAPISTRCTHYPHSIGSLTRRYPCWPHSGVYHSPKWQPDTTNNARLIPTLCNNVLPTSPGPHTHMKPVGLALPPLTRFDLLQSNPVCVSRPRHGSNSQRYVMGYWSEKGPLSSTQASLLCLVPSSTSHLTHFLFMFQLPVSILVKCF